MAFNPFTAFQRNQKFWMATVLLLCMITFVFCTGVGGDLSDRLMNALRPRGASIAQIDGKSITRNDLWELRRQRDMANEFMRVLAKEAVKNYSDRIKTETDKLRSADEKQRQQEEFRKKQQMIQEFSLLRAELLSRLQQPRWFPIGNKLDDLMEFMVWEAQADRLGVSLAEEYLHQMVLSEVYNFVNREQMSMASLEARRGNQLASDALLAKALTDEYRVRLAQLATIAAEPADYNRPGDIRITDPLQPKEIRAPMSPAMMWDFYKQKRSQYDVKIIPVHVSDFISQVGMPTESQQEAFFRRYQDKPYDPTEATPGLLLPARARAAFVMADPNSPAYLDQARARLVLPLLAPCLDPLQSAPIMAARVLGAEAAYQAALERAYGSISQVGYRGAALHETDIVSPLAAWLARRDARSAASLLGNVTAGMTAEVITAPFTTPHIVSGYLAWGALPKHRDTLETGLRAEIRERAPLYSAWLGAAASPLPLYALLGMEPVTMMLFQDRQPPLPLAVVRQEIEDIMAHEKAEQWARDNMRVVRDKLERLSGNVRGFELTLGNVVAQYKLRYGVTRDFYSRYNIAEAPDLAPLEQAFHKYVDQINFLESRDVTPERMLKGDDFYKLFFGSERFTAEGTYRALPWPPVVSPAETNIHVRRPQMRPDLNPALEMDWLRFLHNQDPARPKGTFDLFAYAEKPALYWRTAEESPEKPRDLKQVVDRVVDGWKLEQARDTFALVKARDIARDLQQKGDFSNDVLTAEAAKAGHPVVDLLGVSELYPERTGQFGLSREYGAYPLPKGVFSYPRDDMVPQLLKLYNLTSPIKISASDSDLAIKRQLDAINKELFDKTRSEFKGGKADGKFVQILTNKPLTELYIAVVPFPPIASRDDFLASLQRAPWMAEIAAWMQQMRFNPRMPAPPNDPLIVLAQKEQGNEVRRAVLDQLRTLFDVKAPEDPELRQDFDRGN